MEVIMITKFPKFQYWKLCLSAFDVVIVKCISGFGKNTKHESELMFLECKTDQYSSNVDRKIKEL